MVERGAASNTLALHERARAKVNLTLRVLGRRADGYHELASLVAFADVADELTLTPSDVPLSLRVTGPRAAECGDLGDNLVIKAAHLLRQRQPDLRLGEFTLQKGLPVAAGIGGGSADAAAALRLLASANHLAVDDDTVVEAARATGADVPVCLRSQACTMEGVGERVTALSMPRLPCVLINPGVPVATKDVFVALGLQAGQSLGSSAEVETPWPGRGASLSIWLQAIAAGRNDLEAPALRVQPVIAEVLTALRASPGCVLARMSGSGATCFALFDDDAMAGNAAQRLRRAHPGWWIEASALS